MIRAPSGVRAAGGATIHGKINERYVIVRRMPTES